MNELTRTRAILADILNKLHVSPEYVEAVMYTDIRTADDLLPQLLDGKEDMEAFQIKKCKFALSKDTAIKLTNLKLNVSDITLSTNKGDKSIGKKWDDDQTVPNSKMFIKE
jgi:hypothetical protein